MPNCWRNAPSFICAYPCLQVDFLTFFPLKEPRGLYAHYLSCFLPISQENALELWNKALVKKPFVSTWILERARVYRELQQFDTAKKELESLKEQVLKPIEVLLHDIAEERSHVQHLIDTSSSSSTASVKS